VNGGSQYIQKPCHIPCTLPNTYGYLTYWHIMNTRDNVFVFSLLGLC